MVVVIRQTGRGLAQDVRHAVGKVEALSPQQLTVFTGAEVVCVDGVKSSEAVVIHQLRTGRLVGVNASTLLTL